jgi:hypothetical protein
MGQVETFKEISEAGAESVPWTVERSCCRGLKVGYRPLGMGGAEGRGCGGAACRRAGIFSRTAYRLAATGSGRSGL